MGGHRLVAPRNLKPLRSVTVFGAVSSSLRKPIFLTSTTTNAEQFSRFLDHLIEHTKYLSGKPVLILDNHRAHKTPENMLKMQHHYDVLFQPPYTSEANAQETVWSQVKAVYLRDLYRRDFNIDSQQTFHSFVFGVLCNVTEQIDPRKIVQAPNWWLDAHRQMRTWPQYMDLARPQTENNPE